jgi:hypothetical protein
MNGFVRHPIIRHLQPTWYCFADPVFFDGSMASNEFLSTLNHNVFRSQFIAPFFAQEMIARKELLPRDRTHYVAFRGVLKNGLTSDIDLTRPVPRVINCAQLAIMSAMYMGCREIYLLGMDHDWLADPGSEKHFYNARTLQNHSVATGELGDYAARLKDAGELWQGYSALQQYAAKRGVKIINCTRGGYLDIFPRMPYEAIIGGERVAA